MVEIDTVTRVIDETTRGLHTALADSVIAHTVMALPAGAPQQDYLTVAGCSQWLLSLNFVIQMSEQRDQPLDQTTLDVARRLAESISANYVVLIPPLPSDPSQITFSQFGIWCQATGTLLGGYSWCNDPSHSQLEPMTIYRSNQPQIRMNCSNAGHDSEYDDITPWVKEFRKTK